MTNTINTIFTHLTDNEKNLLLDLASKLPEGAVIVEIGSYLGASTTCLASGIKGKGSKVYAVDTWENHAMSEGQRDTYKEFRKNTEKYRDNITALRGFSTEIAQSFDMNIDLLFIDADHSYEGVSADLRAWLPKLKDGAIIVFHDFSWAEGVQRAVKEFVLPIQAAFGETLDSVYLTRVTIKKEINYVPDATVCIPTFKRNQYVLDALNSILSQKTSFSYEILVLDNACDPDLCSQIEAIAANADTAVRYVAVPEIGLHNCRNKALFLSLGNIVVFVDDDVLTPECWLENILLPFESGNICMVGGRTMPKWEAEQPAWLNSIHPSYFSLLDLGTESREMKFPEAPYGCNMAVRRREAIRLLGFSPDSIGSDLFEWKRGDGESGFARKVYKENMGIFYSAMGNLYHRIPPSRLTKSFLYKRTIKSAISGFYSEVRQNSYNRKQLLVLSLSDGFQSFLALIKSLVIFSNHDAALSANLRSIKYLTRALYQLRLVIDKDLRSWVKQEHYPFSRII